MISSKLSAKLPSLKPIRLTRPSLRLMMESPWLLKTQLFLVLSCIAAFCVVWSWRFPHISPAWPTVLLIGAYNGGFHVVHLLLQRFKKEPVLPQGYAPLVSILVPCHNEAAVIPETLDSLRQQQYTHFEIIAINDRSVDDTARVLDEAESAWRAEQSLRVLHRPQHAIAGKSAALNDALQLAQGELILILDADAWIPPSFLEQVTAVFADETISGVQVPKVIKNIRANAFTRWQQLEYMVDASIQSASDLLGSAVEFRGNGMMLRRDVIERLGGWTEHTVTDDLDLSTRFHMEGEPIAFVESTYVREEGLTRWGPLYRQRIRWAQGGIQRFIQYGLKLAFFSNAPIMLRVDSLAYSFTFVLPSVLLFDAVWMLAHQPHWLSWLGVWGMLGLSISTTSYLQLLKGRAFRGRPWYNKPFDAVCSAVYMMVLWSPVVIQAVIRILLQSKPVPHWEKTPRAVKTSFQP